MPIRHPLVARLAPAALALTLATVPAHAAGPRVARPSAGAATEPAGVATLLKFGSCAFGVAIAATPQGLVAAFINCARTLYDEQQKER